MGTKKSPPHSMGIEKNPPHSMGTIKSTPLWGVSSIERNHLYQVKLLARIRGGLP
jgi:hypothetical protein